MTFVLLLQPSGKSSCTEQHNHWDTFAMTTRAPTNPTGPGKNWSGTENFQLKSMILLWCKSTKEC
jgi:hypothetical protein